MTRFYQNWLGKRQGLNEGMPKAEALREAKQWLRGLTGEQVKNLDPRGVKPDANQREPAAPAHFYTHPYYWAGFILVGDPD